MSSSGIIDVEFIIYSQVVRISKAHLNLPFQLLSRIGTSHSNDANTRSDANLGMTKLTCCTSSLHLRATRRGGGGRKEQVSRRRVLMGLHWV